MGLRWKRPDRMPPFCTYCKPSLPGGWPLAYYRLKRGRARHSTLEHAYDDWVRRGRAADALLAYQDHYGPDDHFAAFLRPDVGVMRVEADLDYFVFSVSVSVEIDTVTRTV